jgi:hypothetical protein
MQPAAIRANPETRLPGRTRRDYGIVRDMRVAWVLAARSIARMPLLFLAATASWGIARFLCWHGLSQAHLGLATADTIADVEFWRHLGRASDLILILFGPLILAALLMPRLHRRILGAVAPLNLAIAMWRSLRVLLALTALALGFLFILIVWVGLPLSLLRAIGPVSTRLTFLLLLPFAFAAMLGVLRLTLGLPALSLGLRDALAEGWAISRFQVARTLATFLGACAPLIAGYAAFLTLGPDPLGWPATVLHPVLDVLSITVAGSLTGLLYRDHRLAPALRPDRRPSRHRDFRREPALNSASKARGFAP